MSEPEWSIEIRDHISALTRDEMIQELCEADADCYGDYRFQDYFEMDRDGWVGWRHRSNWYLRNELYDRDDVPKEERLFKDDEVENPGYMTVGALIEKLFYEIPKKDNPKDFYDISQWRVMIRVNLDNDVLVGSRIADVKPDGFHETIELVGPDDRQGGDSGKAKDGKA